MIPRNQRRTVLNRVRIGRRSLTGLGILAVIALAGCGETLNPSFTADVTNGPPGLTVNFTNTSEAGAAKSPLGTKAGRERRVLVRSTTPEIVPGETKAPERTIPRPPTADQRLVATFFLNTQGTIQVGASLTATNQTIGADVSEWEVTGPSGVVFPPATDPEAGQTRDLPPVPITELGTYTVTLTVTDTDFNVSDSVSASIRAVEDTGGNITEAEATYTWDFGDGTEPQEIPLGEDIQHSYANPGTYTVTLTMERGGTTATETMEDLIRVFDPPDEMEFAAVRMTASGPNTFMFTDESIESALDPIVMWMWDFGDGQTATTTMPSVMHTYAAPGIYSVTLTVVTQNGGESTATRANVVQVLSVEEDGGGGAFDVANYFPLAVGNRWVYRNTGSTSFLPYHFALNVVAMTPRTDADGNPIDVFTVAVQDALDRNFEPDPAAGPLSGGFLIARARGAVYAFRDEAALNLFLQEDQLEPFFSFAIANADLEPRDTTLFDAELETIDVTYEQDSLFGFLPELLTENDYRALIDAASGEKSTGSSKLQQPRANPVAKFSGSPQSARAEKSAPAAATKGVAATGIAPESIGVGDQSNSIAMRVDGQIPYVFSEGVGITYLVGSALTDFFPIATVGPGSEFFAIDSTFTLEYAIVGGTVYGTDDHNDMSDPSVIFNRRGTDAMVPDFFPTPLIPNFGALPGHLSGADVDVFYLLTSSTEGGVTYSLDVVAQNGAPLTTVLQEIDADYMTLLGNALDPAGFEQSFPFSEFLVTVQNESGTGEAEYTINLFVEAGGDDHADGVEGATPINIDQTLNGNIEVIGDRDVFAFTVQAGTTYTIETSNASFAETDTLLELLDDEGRPTGLSDDDGGFGLFSQIEFTPETSGTFFAVVSGFGDAVGPYTITVLLGEAVDADADDHGNTIAEATPLIVNDPPTRGNIEQFGDVDDFTFNAVAGQAYVVETASAANTDTFLFVFDEDYLNDTGIQTFFFNDDGGEGFTSRIVFIAAETEPLFIEVQGFQNQVAGRYTISVTTTAIIDDHGDSADDATAFTDTVDGMLDVSGDVDAFTFDATAGTPYIFATSGAEETDTVLQVFDATGTLIAENDDAGATLFSAVLVTPAVSGPLTIVVRGFADSVTGAYTLSVLIDDHGNGAADATPIVVGEPATPGTIEFFGDFDWFSFNVAADTTYIIETGPQNGVEFDTELFLLDVDGNTLSSNDDGLGLGFFSQIVWFSDREETLFAAVAGFNDAVTGSYTIRVTSEDEVTDDHGNDIASATPVPVNATGEPGAIEFGNDFDFFAFDAQSGQSYSIDTFGLDFDATLEIVDDSGATLDFNDDTFGLAPYLFFSPGVNATYYVVVAGSTTADVGVYNLLIREDDYTDSFLGATAYTVDSGPLSGELEMLGVPAFPDYDVFEVAVEAGVVYNAETLTPAGAAEETDTVLAIFDDLGQEFSANDDRDDCFACTSQLFFSTDYTGVVYVRVESYFEEAGFVAHGPYELVITTEADAPLPAQSDAPPRTGPAAK